LDSHNLTTNKCPDRCWNCRCLPSSVYVVLLGPHIVLLRSTSGVSLTEEQIVVGTGCSHGCRYCPTAPCPCVDLHTSRGSDGLVGLGFVSSKGQEISLFSKTSRPALESTQPIQWVPGSFTG